MSAGFLTVLLDLFGGNIGNAETSFRCFRVSDVSDVSETYFTEPWNRRLSVASIPSGSDYRTTILYFLYQNQAKAFFSVYVRKILRILYNFISLFQQAV
jgi:hypothetical protein